MSPDIHWQIGEDKEQETIHATSPRRSRRGWIAIVIVVILSAGLGVVYRSLPEPPSSPTPTPSPTPVAVPTHAAIPAALFQAIDREAQALADGDLAALRELRTTPDIAVLPGGFTAWGHPGDDRPVYEIIDFKLQDERQAWADIRQYRAGRYFRVTRFYRRMNDRWQSAPSFWLWSSQQEHAQTAHFSATYAVEDRDLISPTLQQLERDYAALCRDLNCAAVKHPLTITVEIGGREGAYAYPILSGYGDLWLPSPRVSGFYESGRAYTWHNNPVHWVLAQIIVQRVYGDVNYDSPGGGLLWTGGIWAVEHLDPLPEDIWNQLGDLTQRSLLSLDALWELGRVNEPGPGLIQLNRLLRFIEQEYGAASVTRLLVSIASARSLPEAIETGVGLSYPVFNQQWQAWAMANLTQP
jgi:hypothetical protein